MCLTKQTELFLKSMSNAVDCFDVMSLRNVPSVDKLYMPVESDMMMEVTLSRGSEMQYKTDGKFYLFLLCLVHLYNMPDKLKQKTEK